MTVNYIFEKARRPTLCQIGTPEFSAGQNKSITLTKKNTRDTFTPTAENFFKRVGGPYLNELWADLLELAADHPTITTFAKLKKGEKAAKMEKLFGDPGTRAALGITDAQTARIAAWLPEGMV